MLKPNGQDQQAADLGDIVRSFLKERPSSSSSTTALPAKPPEQALAPTAASVRTAEEDQFERVAALGYSPLPILPPDAPLSPYSSMSWPGAKDVRGKAPGLFKPYGWTGLSGWPQRNFTKQELEDCAKNGAGVGIRLGDGLIAFDSDTTDTALSKLIWDVFCNVIPGRHVRRYGMQPKFAVLLRVAGDTEINGEYIEFTGKDGLTERVEILSKGSQIVVKGRHPKTGMPYFFDDDGAMPPRSAVVEATPKQVMELLRRLKSVLPIVRSGTQKLRTDRTVDQASLKGDIETIEAALRSLPNTPETYPTRASWITMGIAIKAATADEPERGLEAWAEWSDKWVSPNGEINEPGVAEAEWARMHAPFEIGAGYIYSQAEKHSGWVRPFFGPVEQSQLPVPPLMEKTPQAAIPRSPATRRLNGQEDEKSIPRRDWLIYPCCSAQTVNLVIGAPAVSKSTYMLMLALAVASGEERVLRGADRLSEERLHKHGKVIVYNAEDTLDEIQRRLTGVRKFHGIGRLRHEIITMSGVGDESGDAKLIIAERKGQDPQILRGAGAHSLEVFIREEQPVLVILDPMLSLHRGLSENSNEDMDQVLAILGSIARAGKTTLLVAHHTSKSANTAGGDLNSLRGASAIGAAVRGGISLTKHRVTPDTKQDGELRGLAPGSYVLAKDIKVQYGPEKVPVAYRLVSIPVGNGTGEPLPESAQLLFDDDPAEFLRQSGDYVAVHEIVDRRGSEALAQAAASQRTVGEATRIAEIVLEQLGGRTHAPFNSEFAAIGHRLQNEGMTRGVSRQRISDKLQTSIGRGVTVARGDNLVRVQMAKDTDGPTAPWILRAEVVELKDDQGGLSNLSK